MSEINQFNQYQSLIIINWYLQSTAIESTEKFLYQLAKIDANHSAYSNMAFEKHKIFISSMLLDYIFPLAYSDIYSYICFLMQVTEIT